LSGVSGTLGDTGFAHPFDNDNFDHSFHINNHGFKFGGLYALSNNENFANNRA
jgi:hypothetical protein